MADQPGCLEGAAERIEQHRKGELTVTVTDASGRPVPRRVVSVEQQDSAFLFGCNMFRLDPEDEGQWQRDYRRLFCELLNYATLPFYWGQYEREPGVTRRARLEGMASWCAVHGVRTKGHPLVWHEVFPAWAEEQDRPALELLEARVRQTVSGFGGLVDIWDVINEATVSERFDNAVGRWAREAGATGIAAEAFRWAREAAPDATLVVNDFNVSPQYEEQIEGLLAHDCRPDVIGIQSHMHAGEQELDHVWGVCETYGRFGLPLHYTELTVLSGHYIPSGVNWSSYREDEWPTTPEGEEKQWRYLEQFYTLLFSHPAVEAITVWDFADGGWMNAPGGLVRRDLSPKPAYDRLLELVRGEWRTNVRLTTDGEGQAAVRGFYGRYEVVDAVSGARTEAEHAPGEPTVVTLAVA
jgi:endo-1,4-beta-xylanase